MKHTNTETYKQSEFEIGKKQKIESNENTQQNKKRRNVSYINEIEDEKDFLNMVVVTENREIGKKQKIELNENTQQNKKQRNISYINEIEDEKDFLNMIAITENREIRKERDKNNININQKRKRTQSRQQKFDEYISNLNHIPYDNNKTLFQNILRITDRAQEYVDTLRKTFHDHCKTTKKQTTPTPFTTITTPTFSTTTCIGTHLDKSETQNIPHNNITVHTITTDTNPKELKLPTSPHTQLSYTPKSILQKYVMRNGIVNDKQDTYTKNLETHMKVNVIEDIFSKPLTIIIDEETILAIAKEDEPDLKPNVCKSSKHIFEESRTIMTRKHTTIIQIIDSTNRNTDEVLFCIIGKNHIHTTEDHTTDHIYFNWKQYWDNNLNTWDENGDFQTKLTQNKIDSAMKKSVNFTPQTYKNKIYIHLESFTDIDTQLPKFIDEFESEIDQKPQVKIPRVIVGILGTRSKTRTMLTRLLQKMKNPELLKNRIVYCKNLKQYKNILDELSVTHVIDTRHGYLRKVTYDNKIARKCFLITNSRNIIEDSVFKQIDKIEEALETKKTHSQDISETDNEQVTKPINKYPQMIEKYVRANDKNLLGYPHEQGGTKKFITWNMNSIRSVNAKNFLTEFLLTCNADIIGITEVKSTIIDTLTIKHMKQILMKAGYFFTYFNTNDQHTGQHGTAIFSRIAATEVIKDCGSCSHTDGRLLTAIFEDFIFILSYTPTLSKPVGGEIQGLERRLEYDTQLREHMKLVRNKYKKPIILSGDLNTAIYNHHGTHKYLFEGNQPSCTKEEQQRIQQIMKEHDLTVTHDEIHKNKQGNNSTFYMNDNSTNTRIGLKIDHFLTPKEWFEDVDEDKPKVLNCSILRNQQGSDHLPISMTVRFPDKFTFYKKKPNTRKQKALDVYIDRFMNTPHKQETEYIHPLRYTGVHGRSEPLRKFTGSDEEHTTMLTSLIETKQRLDKLSDEQLLTDPEFNQQTQIHDSKINTIREEQRENLENRSWIPHIEAKFRFTKQQNTHQKIVMVDTGANHNVIDFEHLQKITESRDIKLEEANIHFKVGDKSTVQVLGKIKLKFEIEGRIFIESFYVMNNANFDVLLGCAFTHKYKAKIDFNKHKMTLGINTTKFTTEIFPKNKQRKKRESYKFISTDETLVKAHSITTVETTLHKKARERLRIGQFGAIEKSSSLLTRFGCAPSQGFYFYTEENLNINILNSTGRDITIPKHEEIANYIPCEIEEYSQEGLGLPISDSELHTLTETEEEKYTDIPKASNMPDYSPEELEEIFSREGLKNMKPNLKLEDMCAPEVLTQSQLDRLKQLIAKRSACWAIDDSKPHHVRHYSVNIPHSNKPTIEKLKPYTAEEVEHWKKYVEELRSNGTVEYSQSPWRSASFLVKKPNGGYRFVTDYRRANLQVPKMHWPLVRIDSALSALGNANVISSMDANSAYHQIPLADDSSKEWTSFAGPTCQLQYTTLPQGYKNSVSEYSRFTSYVLGSLVWQCCLTYLDDFLCWSPDFDQHLIDLDNILRRIEYFGIQFSAKKSLFCRKELPYLGHVIQPGKGISPNPKKVQAIRDMKEPKTKKQLGTFLQSLSFYRRMIPLFNRMSSPLRTKYNNKKFTTFTEEEKDSFEQLKKALCECPVLAIPDLNPEENPFYVITDASKEGLGAILLQKGKDNKLHPISYISRMTEDKEKRRYTTYQLEMAAIVWSLQVFKPYLRYKKIPFILRTDCQSLCWLLNSDHDAQIKKWIFSLTEFDFTIEYLRGIDNPSDVLSRLPLPVPQEYFNEIPLENLYSEDHSKMMKFIIECLELRTQKKHKSTKNKQTRNTRQIDDEEMKKVIVEEVNKQKRKMNDIHYNLDLNCLLTTNQKSIETKQRKENRETHINTQQSQLRKSTRHEQKSLEEKTQYEESNNEVLEVENEQDQDDDLEDLDDEENIEYQKQVERNIIINDTLNSNHNEHEFKDPDENKQENTDATPTPQEQMTLIQQEFNTTNFIRWQNEDEKTKKIIEKLQTVPDTHEIRKTYRIIDGILHINNEQLRITYNKHKNNKKIHQIRNEWSRYVPNVILPKTELPIKWWVLTQFHGLPHTGHLGHIGTYNMLRQHFYWPGIFTDVGRFIASCLPCVQRKTPKQNRYGQHKSVLQTRPFEVVSIDLVGPWPKSDNKNFYVLTIVDHFTRYPIAIPITNNDAVTVATALKTHLFMAYPFWPIKIVSDKGTEFKNHIIQEIYRQLGIKQILTSHDNPQSNQVERFHRYMNAAISVFIKNKKLKCTWDQYVDCAVFVYRCSTNTTTGQSPFYALYGKHPLRPMDYMLNMNEQKYDNNLKYTEDILKSFRETYRIIHENQQQESIANMKRNRKPTKEYKVGDIVNVWRKHDPQKLDWRFAGPFTILEKRNDNSYIVDLGKWKSNTDWHKKGDRKTKQVSIRHLKPYTYFTENIKDTSKLHYDESDLTENYSNDRALHIENKVENTIVEEIESPEEEEKEPLSQVKYDSDKHIEIQVDTFCIIPHWGWSEIDPSKRLWCLGKIIEKFTSVDENKKEVVEIKIRRYGNDSNDNHGEQKPGWIENKEGGKCVFRTKEWKEFKTPYTNDMIIKNERKFYKMTDEDITYHGFQLTEKKCIPDSIFARINNNDYLLDENDMEEY